MSNEKLTQEDRVKLIKWGCKYVEVYRILKYKWGAEDIECPSHSVISVTRFHEYTEYYRDFLQQVIEGVNRTEDQKIIQQDHEGLMVLSSDYKTIEKSIYFTEDDASIIEAKEAALIYIMDQEGEE